MRRKSRSKSRIKKEAERRWERDSAWRFLGVLVLLQVLILG
jgi:hypothetical protein